MRRTPDDESLLALLGVDETAGWDDVRRAFRAAVRDTHPDLHDGDLDAERRLKTLNAAWESINTPERWAAFLLAPPSGGGAGRRGAAPVPAAVARLRVRRQQRGSTGLSSWNLELDGTTVARIANGGMSVVDIEPGPHTLRVFHGTTSSPPLQIAAVGGRELQLGCRQVESLRVSLFSPKRALILELLGHGPAR